MTRKIIIIVFVLLTVASSQSLKPYEKNSSYWQYKGEPALLIGASNNDNIFQSADFEDQLYRLKSAGGNYIRCTLSSRDNGDLQPHKTTDSGLYDLNELDETYRSKFERLISLASKLDIFVQIELWDRFDYSRDPWKKSSFNPGNTISYTYEETGLGKHYPDHPSSDKQPFFHSIKGMPKYQPELENVLIYQKKFIQMILDITLEYENILYCMNNETTTPKEWGRYWIDFVNALAAERGKEVYATDMFDEFFKPEQCEVCREAIRRKDIYEFLDVSQINSRNFEQSHWDTLCWIMDEVQAYKRPVNCTKIYGGGNTGWGSGTLDDGVERFFRNIFGGVAAARFHRPPTGNGLNERSVAAIRTVRLLESYEKFWNVEPAIELLAEREDNEAYLVKNRDNSVMFIYFPYHGEVIINSEDLNLAETVTIDWLDITYGRYYTSEQIDAKQEISLKPPLKKGCIAVLTH